jgi:putative colanic acid biosynthesis acetyltransferase WcaF
VSEREARIQANAAPADGRFGADRRYQDLRAFRLPAGFRGRSGVTVQLWWIVQALLFRTSPQACFGWRRFLLRLFGASIGARVLIRPSARITYPWYLTIGDDSWIGDHAELYTLDRIVIGRSAVVSQGCYICTGSHDLHSLGFDITRAPVTIGDEAWVAAQAFVMPGVTIGRGAVVGARSLVLADVPAAAIVTGHPARLQGWRKPHEIVRGGEG